MAADDERLKADLDSVTSLGKRLKLSGDELAKYVRQHMKGLGYGTQVTFVPPAKGEGKQGGFLAGLFGNGDEDDDE